MKRRRVSKWSERAERASVCCEKNKRFFLMRKDERRKGENVKKKV